MFRQRVVQRLAAHLAVLAVAVHPHRDSDPVPQRAQPRVVDLDLEARGGDRLVLHPHRLGDRVDVLLVGRVDPLHPPGLHTERCRRGEEGVGHRRPTQGILHHGDLALEGGLTAVMDRLGRHPVLHGLARLLGALGHVLGRSGLFEQRAVLEDGEVEVAELDPVGARQQQLAVGAGMPGGLVATEARREILDPVSALGELPFVDEVETGLTLRRAHLGHGVAQALLVDVDSTPHVVRRR